MSIGAIDELSQELTTLGQKLTLIPCHPRLGKMVLMACMFKCLTPILDVVAVLSDKDPFLLSNLKMRNKIKYEIGSKRAYYDRDLCSDHLMFHNLYQAWENAYDAGYNELFCHNNHLNNRVMLTMWKIKKDVYDRLVHLNMIKDLNDANFYSNNINLIKGVICSSFNVAKCGRHERHRYNYVIDPSRKDKVGIDYKSVNQNKFMPQKYMTYFNASVNRKGNIHIRDCTNLSEKLVNIFTRDTKCNLGTDLQDSFEEFLDSNNNAKSPTKTVNNVLKFIRENVK